MKILSKSEEFQTLERIIKDKIYDKLTKEGIISYFFAIREHFIAVGMKAVLKIVYSMADEAKGE
jgi:hypothetical protein